MAPWSCMRVNYVPMTLGIVFAMGLVLCYTIAVIRGDVSPYIPFISETGGKFPEAGIFSIFLYLGSTLGVSTVFVRFLIVDELNKGIDRGIDILNRCSFLVGFISIMGMVIVAAYPMTSIPTAHSIGANVLFLGGVFYAALQTGLSYKMSPYYNGKTICHIRLFITICSALALISLLVTGPMAMSAWSSGKPKHWTGSKVPGDEGFDLVVVSSVSEWAMAIAFIAFYFTFIREFGKVCMHLKVQLLVQHFDEDPREADISVATEQNGTINQRNSQVPVLSNSIQESASNSRLPY